MNFNKDKEDKKLKFDTMFLKEFYQVINKYFYSEKIGSFFLLLLITLCTIGSVRSMVALNKFNQNFYNALQSFNAHSILNLTWQLLLIMLLLMFSMAYNVYFTGLLSIRWRRLATKKYLGKWLKNKKYYYIKLTDNKVDNPDQRIANDLDQFPETTLFIFSLLLNSVLTFLSFSLTLWNASVPIHIGNHNYIVPGFFCICAFIFACTGTLVTSFIGKKLSAFDYSQQRLNANFRLNLIKLQEASEEIAFYRGEKAEKEKLSKSFSKVITNALSINQIKKRLAFFSNGYTNIGIVLGMMIATPFYLNKQIDMGTLMLVSGAFTYTINSFSIFVNIFPLLAGWRATINRIVEFDKTLRNDSHISSQIVVKKHDSDYIELTQLNISTPQGKSLFSNINLILSPATGYLLKGSAGIGKSTLFKAMSGLWTYGNGTIIFPKDVNVFFLPQRPYLFEGTLKANLIYPNIELNNHIDFSDILNRIGLGEYQKELDSPRDWRRTLSLGQQQLVGFGRILINQPDIIFLDEATSALDEKNEAFLYTYLRNQLPNSIILSIGHRNSLDKFHEKILYAKENSLVLETEKNNNRIFIEEMHSLLEVLFPRRREPIL